jgi:hypothetical protein
VSGGVREKSGSSIEDILKIYSNENGRTRREREVKGEVRGNGGKRRSEARLGSILIDPILFVPIPD